MYIAGWLSFLLVVLVNTLLPPSHTVHLYQKQQLSFSCPDVIASTEGPLQEQTCVGKSFKRNMHASKRPFLVNSLK